MCNKGVNNKNEDSKFWAHRGTERNCPQTEDLQFFEKQMAREYYNYITLHQEVHVCHRVGFLILVISDAICFYQ